MIAHHARAMLRDSVAGLREQQEWGSFWGMRLLGQVPISPVFLLSSWLGYSGTLVLGDPPLVFFDV